MADEVKPQEKPADEKPQEGAAPQAAAAPQAPPQEGAVVRDGPAWEKREALGPVNAVIETIKAVALNPGETFETMKREGGVQTPLLFALVALGAGSVGPATAIFLIDRSIRSFVSNCFVLGICAVVGPFVLAGLIHGMLKVMGRMKHSFETTYRTVCYAYAPVAAGVIPVCGLLLFAIGGVWALVCVVVGLTKTQECTTGEAVVAAVVPLVVLSCAGIVLMGLSAMLGFGAMAASRASGGL